MNCTVWECQVCGMQNHILDDKCGNCDLQYGTENIPFDIQKDDIDGWE